MTPDVAPWYVAGPLLGLVIVAMRALLNKPFGALGGYIDLATCRSASQALSLRGFVLLGIVLGGAVYTLALGSFTQTLEYPAGGATVALGPVARIGLLLAAGIAIGLGARLAGGCTSGHGMCGVSIGSRASLVACMTFFATAVAFAHGISLAGGGP